MQIIKLPNSFSLNKKNVRTTVLTLTKFIKPKNSELAVDLSELKEMGKGDLMVLLAQMEKSILTNNNKLYRKGKMPTAHKIKNLLNSADKIFHENKSISVGEINDAEKEKLINPGLIDNIVNDLKKIGIKEYYHPFNVFLTELIGNAVEHGIENEKINWWLTHEIDRNLKIAKYTFVDMGLGIVKSHKNAGLPFKYRLLNNSRIVIDAFLGKLGSSTKKSYRGRGLPQLKGMIEKEFVTNLQLITNCVSLQFKDGSFITTKIPDFEGTYYSWTINQNNYQKWKNIK